MYELVDIDNWDRKEHYNFFKKLDIPQYNICSNIDVTNLYNFVKDNNLSFYKTMIYSVTKAVNNISELKYRIKNESVIKYDTINPAFTMNTKNELFSFLTVDYTENFNLLYKKISDKVEDLKGKVSLDISEFNNNVVYLTCAPWINFTSVSHAISISKIDSIPRITWGKFTKERGLLKMPLSIQVQHALVDGYHLGAFYNFLQNSIIEDLSDLI